MDTSTLGGKIGPRIAEILSKTLIDHKAQSADLTAQISRNVADQIMQHVNASLGDKPTAILEALADHPDIPPEMKAFVQQLAGTPTGMDIAAKLMMIAGVMGAAMAIGMNQLQPGIYAFISHEPNLRISGQEAAEAVARGIISNSSGESIGADNGFNSDYFTILEQLATTWPGMSTVLDLLRRGLISTANATEYLERSGYRTPDVALMLRLQEVLLPPEVLSDAVTKGWMDPIAAAQEAAQQGLSNERFGYLLDINGEPPGLMQLLEAYRRGIIDQSRLEEGIKQSRVRNEWIPTVEGLRYMPPGPAECLEGYVKGHLSAAESQSLAKEAGLDPAHWQWLADTTGNPPGGGEMLQLWNRGEISQDRVVQALKQGHLSDTYIDDVLKLRRRMPEVTELLLMQQAGTFSKSQVSTYLAMLGYDSDDAAAIGAAGSRSKISADWTEAKTLISDQYQSGTLTYDQAQQGLMAIGYEQDEADSVLSVVDLKRLASQQSSVISKLRTLFVGHHLSSLAARNNLLAIHMPSDQVDNIMTLWTLEREASVKSLTEAQIVDAWSAQILDQASAQNSLEGLGYQPHDAWVLLSIKNKQALPNEPPLPATS